MINTTLDALLEMKPKNAVNLLRILASPFDSVHLTLAEALKDSDTFVKQGAYHALKAAQTTNPLVLQKIKDAGY